MEIPELIAGVAIYMESQYGVSFGLLIAPLSALIFLIAIYIILFRNKQELEDFSEDGFAYAQLEQEMLVLNQKDREDGLVSVGCTTCHLKTAHTHREKVTDYL